MPKKTRQEKILAQLKRLQQIQSSPATKLEPQAISAPIKSVVSTELKSLETRNNAVSSGNTTKTLDYSYAFSDLRKTLIFVAVAIIFEIILSLII